MASDKDRGNLIGGTWVTGNGAERTSHNPARDGEVVWRGHAADAAQAEQAIAAAHGAFAAWAARGYEGRRAILERLADVAAERTEELAQAITAEMGKPIREARGEAGSLPGKLRASIAAWENLPNVALAGAPGRALWRPHGVMAVIGPSNYPIHLMHTHVAPALLAGNTVVCKPSRVTPMSGQIYAEIMASIGLPEGVFNLLVGTREVGGVLVRHEDVHAIAFTGSWGGGRRIAEACLDQPRKLLALEMGGKNVAVVLDDAHLGQTVHELVLGATLTAGQRCTATSRLVVHRGIADAVLDRLTEALGKIEPGDPLDDATLMGPLATMGAADDFLRDLETIEGDPGIDTLVRTRRLPGGAFVTPSMHRVREHTEGARRYLQTELFAPNLAVEVVDDDDAALEVARASAFGLSLGVFTRDEARFERFVHGAPWGLFNHNRSTNNASGLLPFGGLGFSGNHRPAGSTSALYCSRAIGVLQKDWGRFDPDPRYASVLDGLIE